MAKDEQPIDKILKSGSQAILDWLEAELQDQDEITLEIINQVLTEGVMKGIKEINFGLHALSPQDEKTMLIIQQARQQIPGDFELKVVAVPKQKDGKILDPHTNRPASKDSKIIMPK